jgi:hypothetical protein
MAETRTKNDNQDLMRFFIAGLREQTGIFRVAVVDGRLEVDYVG